MVTQKVDIAFLLASGHYTHRHLSIVDRSYCTFPTSKKILRIDVFTVKWHINKFHKLTEADNLPQDITLQWSVPSQ